MPTSTQQCPVTCADVEPICISAKPFISRQDRRLRRRAMKNINTKQLDRRSFIRVSALAGDGMLIGFYTDADLLAQERGQAAAPTPINPNTYIKVHPDNTFTIMAKNPETGQGIRN